CNPGAQMLMPECICCSMKQLCQAGAGDVLPTAQLKNDGPHRIGNQSFTLCRWGCNGSELLVVLRCQICQVVDCRSLEDRRNQPGKRSAINVLRVAMGGVST